MGLFGPKKSGKVFLEAFERDYDDALEELAGANPSVEELASAHHWALKWAHEGLLNSGVMTDVDSVDLKWLRASAYSYGIDEDDAVRALTKLRKSPVEPPKHADIPTSRKVVLADDGRGVLIFGRDPNDSDSSWKYRVDPGIDFSLAEELIQIETNHMDVDLGLPISWPRFTKEAEEYARKRHR